MLLGWSLTWIASLLLHKSTSEGVSQNRERQEYFENVIVLREKKPIKYEKTEPQARTLIN